MSSPKRRKLNKKEVEDEKPQKEEIFLFGFKKEQCDVKFVFQGEANSNLYCPSTFLNRITKEFQNNMVKTDDGSHYEIKAEGFGVEALTKALSLYQPKFFKSFQDSDDFRELLEVCSRFALNDVKTDILAYLMCSHKLILGSHSLQTHHYQFLQLAKDFGLKMLYDYIMRLNVESYTEDLADKDAFIGISDETKYEIIKKCFGAQLNKASCNTGQQWIELEATTILHFLDLYFYENKILNYTIYSKDIKDTVFLSITQNNSSSFFNKNGDHDVFVRVEGKELFINSTILTDNSPVFEAMLTSTFKEGLSNVIALPGKRAKDIIELFRALTYRNSTDYNAFSLLPLCREYQIDWLQDLIQEQMLKRQLTSDRMRLKYLKLAHDMDFSKGEEKFVNSLCESFIQIQRYKEFNELEDETKILVALRRLWYSYKYVRLTLKYRSKTCFFCHDFGLLSVFKNVVKVAFWTNTVEKNLFDSLANRVKCKSCNGTGMF